MLIRFGTNKSFGTFKSNKSVYDRVMDLRIATSQIIINCVTSCGAGSGDDWQGTP